MDSKSSSRAGALELADESLLDRLGRFGEGFLLRHVLDLGPCYGSLRTVCRSFRRFSDANRRSLRVISPCQARNYLPSLRRWQQLESFTLIGCQKDCCHAKALDGFFCAHIERGLLSAVVGRTLTSLSLSSLIGLKASTLSKLMIGASSTVKAVNLCKLIIDGSVDEPLVALASCRLESLTLVDIQGTEIVVKAALLQKVIVSSKSGLRTMELCNLQVEGALDPVFEELATCNLESLKLGSFSRVGGQNDQLDKVFKRPVVDLGSLKQLSLNFGDWASVGDKMALWEEVRGAFKSLQGLTLECSFPKAEFESFVTNFLESCPLLQSLKIAGREDLSWTATAIGCHCSALRDVELEGGFGSEGLATFASGCPELKKLSLRLKGVPTEADLLKEGLILFKKLEQLQVAFHYGSDVNFALAQAVAGAIVKMKSVKTVRVSTRSDMRVVWIMVAYAWYLFKLSLELCLDTLPKALNLGFPRDSSRGLR